MLVKIFAMREGYFGSINKAASELEEEINAWLRANPDVRIISATQSSCMGSMDPSRTIVSVWYQDKATQA